MYVTINRLQSLKTCNLEGNQLESTFVVHSPKEIQTPFSFVSTIGLDPGIASLVNLVQLRLGYNEVGGITNNVC